MKKLNVRASNQGFTLVEVLVVVVLAGALAAIAAPSWLAFANRQRIRTARTEVLQVMREAQKEAITQRTRQGIRVFAADEPNPGDPARIEKLRIRDGNELVIRTQAVSRDDVDILLSSVPANLDELFFNFDGTVFQAAGQAGNADGSIYKVVLQSETGDGVTGQKNCVIVETLLGSMREATGDDCD